MASKKPNNNKTDNGQEKEEEKELPHYPFLRPCHLLTIIGIILLSYLSCQKFQIQSELAFEIQRLNNTPLADKNILFFNRVPKVGSQTIMNLLKVLGKRNGFEHYVDSEEVKNKAGEITVLAEAGRRRYADMFLANFTEPSAYNKHMCFVNFRELGKQYYQPLYINFVREPVQRVLSWYCLLYTSPSPRD